MSEKKKSKLKFPILFKTAVVIFVFSLIVVEIAMTYYALVMTNRNHETFNNYGNSLSATIAKVIDVDDYNYMRGKVFSILDTIPQEEWALSEEDKEDEAKVEAYMDHFATLYDDNDFVTKYDESREVLRDIIDANSVFNVDCAYLSFVYPYTDSEGNKQGLCVYIVDSAPDEDACPPGWIDELYEQNKEVLDHQERGFPAYESNTAEYGYLVSAGTYIEGTEKGFAFVDIYMNVIRAKTADSIVRLFTYLLITVLVIAAAGIVIVYFAFSKPLKKVTNVAKSFNNNDPKTTHELFENLNVKSRDELGDLAESIKTMENGVLQRINELVEVNNALISTEKQAAKMTVLANRDSLTSVGSKTAYDTLIEKLNEQIKNKEKLTFGIAMIDLNYLKNTNDEYGHAAGDEALIKLANVICLTFKHSPVYRIGGDEFVVVLRNDDYKISNELIVEFNERISDLTKNVKLPEFARISAAIGYSTFNPKTDTCVDDVFKRADQKMYNRKHDMKEHQND